VYASLLVVEHVLVKDKLDSQDLKRLVFIDAAYGISALVVLSAGLALWFWVGKPAAFYSENLVFQAKLTAFVLMGLISIHPTMFYLRHRNSADTHIQVPKTVIHCIRAETLLLVLIPLLAVFMARGYGLE
jgi:putative membrane protein